MGRACADSLAREGANLAICSRGAEDLDAAAQEIRDAFGVDVLAVPGDLSRPEFRGEGTVDHFGRLDVVIPTPAAPQGGP